MTPLEYVYDKKKKTVIHICKSGEMLIYKKGFLHSTDRPAEITTGYKTWYRQGVIHRKEGGKCGGPAREYDNGNQIWMKDGKKDRKRGPAVVDIIYGVEKWYRADQLHRPETGKWGGPAVTTPEKREYWQHDQLHRKRGPALEYVYGGKKWYRRGVIHRPETGKWGGPAIDYPNRREWRDSGKLHRVGGPAVEICGTDLIDGAQIGECYEWWVDGNLVAVDPTVLTHYLGGGKVEFHSGEFRIKRFAPIT